jgi:hypothetical protein
MRRLLLSLVSVGLGCVAAQADVRVYSNALNDLGVRLSTGSSLVGDEILLARQGLPQLKITSFSFEYWGENMGPNAKVQVSFRANDGPLYGGVGPARMPSLTPLWQSVPFSVSDTPRATLWYPAGDLGNVEVPDRLTWTVQFLDLAPGAAAGVDLFSPPTVGGNFADYWVYEGGQWVLKSWTGGGSLNVDFAATMDAVPEPATWMLGALGVGGYLAFRARTKRAGVQPS